MVNRIVSVHAGICGMGIYAIMLPSSGFSVAHYKRIWVVCSRWFNWFKFARIVLALLFRFHCRTVELTIGLNFAVTVQNYQPPPPPSPIA